MPLQQEIVRDAIELVTRSMSNLILKLTLLEQIKERQKEDEALVKQGALIQGDDDNNFAMFNGEFMCYKDKIRVPYDKELKESIVKEAHTTHIPFCLRSTKMYNDLKTMYWWPGMKKDSRICRKMPNLLPRSEHRDSPWVIIDRLTKSAHFLSVKTTYNADQYAELYVCEIERLHKVPKSIISDIVQSSPQTFGRVYNELWQQNTS
ncbi:uncharacterized protein LOC133792315 [Humulus lupulus]|uniref:uncharacterized protein LOC133792315 n=1 Tax=Humulus lupulus TaxID=3486 RepID=UPI002B405A43|nr:uncharacterized protein LOC133792315 [Humulus lupulus]